MHVHTCANICNLGNIKLLKDVHCYICTVCFTMWWQEDRCQSLGGTSLYAEVIHCGIVLNVLKSVDLWKKTKQTEKHFVLEDFDLKAMGCK